MKHAINTINTMHQFLAGAARMSWCKKKKFAFVCILCAMAVQKS
jgi:hypothetical protein